MLKRRAVRVTLATLLAVGAGTMAQADVVVIVSAKSSVRAMSAQQIAQIYLGESTALTPIDNSPAIRTAFYAKVLGKSEAEVRAIWYRLVFTEGAVPPREFPSDAAVVKAVAADSTAIGYVERRDVNPSVKIAFAVK